MKTQALYSPLKSDLELALHWLRLNKKIKLSSDIEKSGNIYFVYVKTKMAKRELSKFVSDKFGRFVQVK
jgi:hypothetical protein